MGNIILTLAFIFMVFVAMTTTVLYFDTKIKYEATKELLGFSLEMLEYSCLSQDITLEDFTKDFLEYKLEELIKGDEE